MDKPVSILIAEFKQNIISAINNAQLPASIIQEIMIPIAAEISQNARQEYEKALKEYNDSKEGKEV